jgi:hypothetical protein
MSYDTTANDFDLAQSRFVSIVRDVNAEFVD